MAKQTPTQELILEVLAARYRLGEPSWPFSNRLLPAIRGLEESGLVEYRPDVTENTRVTLTDAGIRESTSAGYEPPIIAFTVKSTLKGLCEEIPGNLLTRWDIQKWLREMAAKR